MDRGDRLLEEARVFGCIGRWFPELAGIRFIPDFIPSIAALEMFRGCCGEAAEGSYILRRSRRAASMLRMSVIENPEYAHAASIQRAQQPVVSKEAITAAPFDIRP